MKPNPRPVIGYVPQRLTLEPRLPLTVREFFGASLRRWPILFGASKSFRGKVLGLLRQVGADHLIDRPATALSGGEMQRVLLALALEPQPELLLLDEPAAGIDFVEQQPFYDQLAEVNRRTGVSVLLVSHDLSIVSEHAHHVLCLKNGRIECQGPPGEILTGEAVAATFGLGKRLYQHDHHADDCEHDGHAHAGPCLH